MRGELVESRRLLRTCTKAEIKVGFNKRRGEGEKRRRLQSPPLPSILGHLTKDIILVLKQPSHPPAFDLNRGQGPNGQVEICKEIERC